MPTRYNNPRGSFFSRHRGVIVICLIVLLAGWGIFSRMEASSSLRHQTEENATANVVVMHAPDMTSTEEIVLPGNVSAWHDASIFARTNGYLRSWKYGFGTHVKAGDVLAEIDTPEIDAQYNQARADLATAQANNTLAQSTKKRWVALLKTNSVSKQEADEKIGDAAAKAAAVASAQANLDRLRQLESFKHVTAPFEGTVTLRNTDIGALINAGSVDARSADSPGQELFHIADTSKLRIYVQVPESYSTLITTGMQAELHFNEYPGRVFQAKLYSTSKALNPTTRTLLTQFVIDNGKGELLPGGYTEAHLKIEHNNASSIHLPVDTLIFRAAGVQVASVDEEKKITLKDIIIGRDYGKEVEVTSGVSPNETIVVNPPDSLITGQKVNIVSSKEDAKKDEKKDDKKADKKS